MEQTRFPHIGNGNYTADGDYRKEKKAFQVKFPEQGRFCFGVAIVDHGEGHVGERAHLFDYTCKNTVFIKLMDQT